MLPLASPRSRAYRLDRPIERSATAGRTSEEVLAMMRRRITLAVSLALCLAAVATPAAATYPGTNGRIAFGSDRFGGTHNIFTMNPDGSDVRHLTFLSVDQGAALYASWSPDGTKLVFELRPADSSFATST